MAVISRIMWTADVEGLGVDEVLHEAREAIAPWAMESANELLPTDAPVVFERSGAHNPGLRTVSTQEFAAPAGLRVDVEDEVGGGDVWSVHIRLTVINNQLRVWVDNTLESESVLTPVSVGRPRVVDALMQVGSRPRLGASRILTEAEAIPAAGVPVLHELLANPDRQLPVVVVTCSWQGFDDRAVDRAQRMAKRLTGLATVVMLDAQGQDALKALLPPRLGVWGGATRVYAPGDLETPSAHRVYTSDLLRERGVDVVINWVTAQSSRRRPDRVLRDLQGTTPQAGALETLTQLEADKDELQSQLEAEILERAELEAELNRALDTVQRLRMLGFESGMSAEVVEAEHAGAEQLEALLTVSDAVTRARGKDLEPFLEIAKRAEQALDAVDNVPNALAWGNTVWRGLKALADYARDVQEESFRGGFWNWCEQGGSWPATTKKLAMSESESVQNNRKLANKRNFPVNTAIDKSGQIYMGAHLKISEGGGNLAPRIYFLDDTGGATRKVHVGFIGPHYLVPNTKA